MRKLRANLFSTVFQWADRIWVCLFRIGNSLRATATSQISYNGRGSQKTKARHMIRRGAPNAPRHASRGVASKTPYVCGFVYHMCDREIRCDVRVAMQAQPKLLRSASVRVASHCTTRPAAVDFDCNKEGDAGILNTCELVALET